MTADAPRNHRVAGIPADPVEDLADRMAELLAEIKAAVTAVVQVADTKRETELFDAEDAIISQAEWAVPASSRGALFTAVVLARAIREVDDLSGDEPAQERALRQARRLSERLIEYLTVQAGVSVDQLGLGEIHVERRPMPALIRRAA